MQIASISIWMKGRNWKNSKLLLQKSNKSQGTKMHLHKTEGLKLNPALRREKRGHKRSTDYMSLHVDLLRARATPWDSGKGCESFEPAEEKFSPPYDAARAAWIDCGTETRRRARTAYWQRWRTVTVTEESITKPPLIRLHGFCLIGGYRL